jgi:tetratricopeptide (TPR) repeat protein
LILPLAPLCFGAEPGKAHYVGSQACAPCHKQIAAAQAKTAMAATWQGTSTSWLPPDYDARTLDGPEPAVSYEVRRQGDGFLWSTVMPGRPAITLPVEVVMGGQRHGLGFLARVGQLDGNPLQRPALVQSRYAWSLARGSLVLAPGCPPGKPGSLETGFGLVLSPTFETKCLVCHGQPNTLGAGSLGGVRCESCHGPGSQHLQSVAKGAPLQGIVNPGRLKAEESIAVCAQCHVGLGNPSDPSPEDLLVANQAPAMEASECFVQSGKAFTCVTCHDPHGDAVNDDARSIQACLSCHSSATQQHAAICPINAGSKCLDCHMPSVEMGPLHLVDHLIRVHPEQEVKPHSGNPALRSRIRPLREFLRIIVTNDRAACDRAALRLAAGEAFFDVAREMSIDPDAPIGGYLGPKWLSQVDPATAGAAAKLEYGQTSGVIEAGKRYMIVQRLPRDFRWQAGRLLEQASTLLHRGDASAAIDKSREALHIYPYFLRALVFIGTTYAQYGNPQQAAEFLRLATRLYPDDAGALVDLALMLGELGRHPEEIQAYRRAILLEPDLLAAYAKLGMALYSSGQWQDAIDVFRQGLRINPLSAELYGDLSLALARGGDASGAKQAMKLALAIDPEFVRVPHSEP